MTQNRLSSKSLHPSISLGKSISQHIVKTVAIIAALFNCAVLYSDTGDGMVTIPGGSYSPLYRSSIETEPVQVEAFLIDARPVTNGEFLEFVTANPSWRRSQIKPIFADESYLYHWTGDLDLGPNAETIKDLPAINVSWFASRAYARWKGKRLPTVSEWELVGLASEANVDGRKEEGYYARILEWYGRPNKTIEQWKPETFRNIYGVYGMHGLVWEWVDDFNTALVTGESRGDSELERKLFCGSGSINSSNFRDYAAFMRFGFRSSLSADYAIPNLGFRCAKDIEATNTINDS